MVNRVDRAVDQGVVNHHKMPISYDLIHCDKHRDLKATMYMGFFVVVVFFPRSVDNSTSQGFSRIRFCSVLTHFFIIICAQN